MLKSPLQIERGKYIPKMPTSLKGIVKIVEGEKTQSVADQDQIKAMFPNTYGLPILKFETGNEMKQYPAYKVGVVLSGGQAPGGHNVISGLFDGLKACNPDNRSEEHTSELQSRENLVCRLLLEKKKKHSRHL